MISGNFENFGLIDVLGAILKGRKNCILIAEPAENKRYIAVYFKEGKPILIREVSKSFLVYLDLDFESILRKEGVSKDKLIANIVEKLPMVLSLKKGNFSVTSGFIKIPDDITAPVDTEKLIMHLSRDLSEEEVNRKITDENLIYEKVENYKEKAQISSLNEDEKEILSLIDGTKTVFDIESQITLNKLLKSQKIGDSDEIKKIKLLTKRALYGFLTAGIIKLPLKLKKNETIFDRIIQLLENRPKKSEV
ncbi:MAG: DUF4388 domain-containing protein [Hydrogenothermaceae bacterium]